MKTLLQQFTRGASICALLSALAVIGSAANPPAPTRDSARSSASNASSAATNNLNGTLRVASEGDAANTVHTFSGRRVRNMKGQELGTIKDCVVDAYSGRIVYAVVSSESTPATLRLVPFAALQNTEGPMA